MIVPTTTGPSAMEIQPFRLNPIPAIRKDPRPNLRSRWAWGDRTRQPQSALSARWVHLTDPRDAPKSSWKELSCPMLMPVQPFWAE